MQTSQPVMDASLSPKLLVKKATACWIVQCLWAPSTIRILGFSQAFLHARDKPTSQHSGGKGESASAVTLYESLDTRAGKNSITNYRGSICMGQQRAMPTRLRSFARREMILGTNTYGTWQSRIILRAATFSERQFHGRLQDSRSPRISRELADVACVQCHHRRSELSVVE